MTEEERDEAPEQQPPLPRYIRYKDLVEADIVRSWQQLIRMIELMGFPPGVLLSPNIRAWEVDQVNDWLKARPSARKLIPTTARRPARKTAA